MELPVVRVEGKPHDVGFQHGKKAKEAIQKNVRFYMDLWEYFGGAKKARS